jgi:hypothetical protein
MIEFIATGSPASVSLAIEAYAGGQRSISALVVPWASDGATVSMAVTSAAGEGWAIEHANLGTITLTGLGRDSTRVRLEPADRLHPDQKPRVSLFDEFARAVQDRFQASPS